MPFGTGGESPPVCFSPYRSLRERRDGLQYSGTQGVQPYCCAVRHTFFVLFRSGVAGLIVYRELSSLERDLGVCAHELYALSNNLPRHYRRAQIAKPDGGVRVLFIPDEALKRVQRRIARRLLAHMPVSPHATAYRYGAKTVYNAVPHAGKPMVLKLDIRHFFDSVCYSDVKELAFPADIYAEPLRILLSMLCYYREGLPQGAPSSPAISNLVLRPFDDAAGSWCTARGIAYTRYCDDMTFSGLFDPHEVCAFVQHALNRRGFFLNHSKTHCFRAGQRQTVTGLVVNGTPNVPAEYRRKLRQELYYCRRFGVEAHLAQCGLDEDGRTYLRRLLGRVNYVLQITANDAQMRQAREWLRLQLSG